MGGRKSLVPITHRPKWQCIVEIYKEECMEDHTIADVTFAPSWSRSERVSKIKEVTRLNFHPDLEESSDIPKNG